MSLKDSFIAELKQEAILTQKILERVPLDKADWQPHQKSMTLGRLATHVAEIPHWISRVVTADGYDFMNHPKPHVAASTEELVDILHTKLNKAIADLDTADDEMLERKWVVSRGGQVFFEMQKKVAIRSWGCNHIYHHRGQLSVFLRLLDIPVPGMYGPSADER